MDSDSRWVTASGPRLAGDRQEASDELLVGSGKPPPAQTGPSTTLSPPHHASPHMKKIIWATLGSSAFFIFLSWLRHGGARLFPEVSAPRAPRSNSAAFTDWVQVWQTAHGIGKLQRLPDLEFESDFYTSGPVVSVFADIGDQEILGFGGAFTEASAVVFKRLSPKLQEEFLELYFGQDGLGFSLGRVHINSCDFSEASYNFDEEWNDYNLSFFDEGVVHDTEALIPFIRRAGDTLAKSGKKLRLLASPWSPPPWMKANSRMTGSVNYPGGGLLRQARTPWAKYISKWITAYAVHSIPIWAITVQNEPGFNAPWEACTFTAKEEATFLGEFLGPILQSEHPEVAIFVHDHNKDAIKRYAQASYRHPSARQYVTGVAFHWYSGDQFENVAAVHREFPEAVLLATEATYEKGRWLTGSAGPSDHWSFGEGYAHDIIGDLNAGAGGWIDWNLLVDSQGGPNHVHNYCDAAVVSGELTQALHVHPQYYFLGHFSKFMPPGSTRVSSEVHGSRSYKGPPRTYGICTEEDGLQATAVLRPDRRLAVVILNCGDDTIRFKLQALGKAVKATVPPHAIQTYLFPALPEAPDLSHE